MNNKSTHWVTIPEEKVHTPASHKEEEESGVNHKALWAAGFIVLIILGFTLVAPQQMASLLQGNLFDTSGTPQPQAEQPIEPLEVIRTEEEAPAEETAMEEGAEETPPQTVVQAETEAVSIQITPVEEETTEEGVMEEPDVVAEAQPEETEEDLKAELDANRKLLEELSKQLAEVKKGEQVAVDTAQPTHAAASDTAAEVTTTIGQPQPAATPIGYRSNPYRVTVTPQQVLQQNTAVAQARSTQTPAVSTTPAPTYYDSQLAAAAGTPESGPEDALTVALVLTFVALVGWRFRKIFA